MAPKQLKPEFTVLVQRWNTAAITDEEYRRGVASLVARPPAHALDGQTVFLLAERFTAKWSTEKADRLLHLTGAAHAAIEPSYRKWEAAVGR